MAQPMGFGQAAWGRSCTAAVSESNGFGLVQGHSERIYQNINFIERYDPEYVIILSGDQICKQDYSDFLRFHKEKNAEFSVAVMEVPWEEASRFGLMVSDENDKITEFQEKPKGAEIQSGFDGYLYFQLGYLKEISDRG